MPESSLSVRDKAPYYAEKFPDSDEFTPDAPSFDFPENDSRTVKLPTDTSVSPDAETESDFEALRSYKYFVWAYYFNSSLGDVRCNFPRDAAKLYGADAIERLGLDRKKYVIHVSKAGYLMKAEGFNDKGELEDAMKRLEQSPEIVWNPEKDFSFDECRSRRFEILLKLGFPQEYLWMLKCKPRENFERRWNSRKESLHSPSSKPYVLYLNCGDSLFQAVGFSNFSEFRQACETLAEYGKNSLPSPIDEEIDDLATDLPRKWRSQDQRFSGEAWFAGVAYLGDKVRETLFPEEILYIILKIQRRVKECGAIEAVQTFRSDDGLSVICADTMKGSSDGWKMTVSPL